MRSKSAGPASGGATTVVPMTPSERRATGALAGIYGLRMLGMFIVLPVFALYAETMPGGSDHLLVGLALGVYGLTQAILQLPFGWASDRFGRKPTIVLGLTIFAFGSFVAALATDLTWIIVGRTLQGAGAVSAAVMALTADLTRESVRTRAMAAIGLTIGAAFALSLVAGPLLERWVGVPGLFALTGVLALAAIVVLIAYVPPVQRSAGPARNLGLAAVRTVLANRDLARLNFGIFTMHAVLMALFIKVPLDLRDAGLAPERHWQAYLPVIVASVALMWPALKRFDQPGRAKPIFIGAIVCLAVGEVAIALGSESLPLMVAGLVVFFAAFNLLEAALPALATRFAPASLKGTAVGVFSSVQFLGMFVGGALGGVLAQVAGSTGILAIALALTLAWLGSSLALSAPPEHSPRP